MKIKIDYSLYLITDRELCRYYNLIDMVDIATRHGVSCVQLREKTADDFEVAELAKKLLLLLQPRQVPLIINDRWHLVNPLNLNGVHLGQSDLNPQLARNHLGEEKIIGLSVENIDQANQAQHDTVDYFGVGPIFATNTKRDAAPALGINGLKSIRQLITKPLVAIGGINKTNAKEIIASGADGIAIVSAIMASDKPSYATQQLATLIKEARC